jgi:AraC family transcriptional regulator
MIPTIRIEPKRKLIGQRISMTMANNRTFELWKGFMPRRREIRNNLSAELISMQVYNQSYDFKKNDFYAEFEKWAAIEVTDFEVVPEGMETFLLEGGLYAVFIHKGAASTGPKTFQYIFGIWLPQSDYELDDRPHYEILGEKYKNDDPDSEEEILIPIRPKK